MKLTLLITSLAIAMTGYSNAKQAETAASTEANIPTTQAQEDGFKGVIKTDIRDSTPDWKPFSSKKAKDGSPNILFILYDDTGLAAWSAFGGGINMPTLDKLAANGLTYSNLEWVLVHDRLEYSSFIQEVDQDIGHYYVYKVASVSVWGVETDNPGYAKMVSTITTPETR